MIQILLVIVLVAIGVLWHTVILEAIVFGWLWVVHMRIITWIIAHPLLLAGYVAAYILIGGAWSVAKWWFVETERVRRAREEFKGLHGTPSGNKTWEEFIKHRKSDPSTAYNKSDIVMWIVWWPVVSLYTLLNDPIRRAARRLWMELLGVYQRITDHVWRAPVA